MKVVLSLFFITFSIVFYAQESLKVTISNIENNKGQIILLLFNKGSKFGIDETPYKKYSIPPITGDNVTFSIDNLPKGEYAFLVFHDENNNGKFATNWFGIPEEGIGKSGIQHKRPNFENSKFIFNSKTLIFDIDLKYLL